MSGRPTDRATVDRALYLLRFLQQSTENVIHAAALDIVLDEVKRLRMREAELLDREAELLNREAELLDRVSDLQR